MIHAGVISGVSIRVIIGVIQSRTRFAEKCGNRGNIFEAVIGVFI